MTKKKLLNETTIRRWGKLANIGPLTENFLDEEETLAEEEGEEGRSPGQPGEHPCQGAGRRLGVTATVYPVLLCNLELHLVCLINLSRSKAKC